METLTQLGPYKLVRRIGHGGMAEVYMAVRYGASGFEKRFALKTLLPELRGMGTYERLLIEEAKLGARLDHRNLVRVHDLGVYYACMDYVDGADLDSTMRRARPRAELALLIAEEMCLALEHVHTATDDSGRPLGIVHRDVSPSNVLLSRAGEVKLADFGIAKATELEDRTLGNVRKGKYAYMSPEQVRGDPLTLQSDQFGLGVMLVELLAGRRPFDAESVMQTLDNIARADPPAELELLDAPLAAILGCCLARDPGERYPGAEELRRAIAAVRATMPAVAAPDLGAFVRETRAGAGA
jgi:eukaryotic-like serine/threonine-protein kinase